MEGSIQTLRFRAEEILEDLTLDEKIGMIHGDELFQTKGVERLGIPPLVMSDGPCGVRADFYPKEWKPVGDTYDYVTYLPCNSAIAATWDRNLASRAGSTLGEETRGRGKDVILAPGINLKRTPLCGRNFEYFSEDPFLTSQLASEYVKGVQKWDVSACVKHFALNHQENGRLNVDEEIDRQVLEELYLQVFKDVIDAANPYSIMTAYNKIDGEYCSESKYLLNDILRGKWVYQGFVVSDWGAVHDTQKAAEASIDCEMSVTYDFDDYKMANPLKKMIESGEIDEALIDEKVLRILILMLRLNMIGEDRLERKDASYNTFSAKADVLEISRGSVVLLKNDDNILPIIRPVIKDKKILVIGENANRLHAGGGGSAEIKALYEISPLMGLKSRIGGGTRIDYLPGYCSRIKPDLTSQGTNWQEISLEAGGGSTAQAENESEELRLYREKLRNEAVSACSDYDYVIFVGGLNHDLDSEGVDKQNIELPYEQNELIKALLQKRPDTIVALIGGGCVNMTPWLDDCKSLIWMYYNGMEGGNALAEIIVGDINPSGHLPETFYRSEKDCSGISVGDFGNTELVHYSEGFNIGYRHTCKEKIPVQFPFGYGLTYSDFSISDVSYDVGNREVKLLLSNKSDIDGTSVLQVYRLPDEIHDYYELVGFEKTYLRANADIEVTIPVTDRCGIGRYAVGFNVQDLQEID